jgi:transcriptional regulator with XRE-family HTH domain
MPEQTATRRAMDTETKQQIDRLQRLIQAYLEQHEISMRDLSLRAGDNAGLIKDIMSGRLKSLPRAKTLRAIARAMRIESSDELIDPALPDPDLTRTPAPPDSKPAAARGDGDHVPSSAPAGMAQLIEIVGGADGDTFGYLRSDAVTRSMLAAASQLRVLLAFAGTEDGRIQRGDYALLDASEAGRQAGGLSARIGPGGVPAFENADPGADTAGRVIGVIRPMP